MYLPDNYCHPCHPTPKSYVDSKAEGSEIVFLFFLRIASSRLFLSFASSVRVGRLLFQGKQS
jgi:hypothetical protein